MKKDFVIKDSGKRQGFSSGAVRDTKEGKILWDLLPFEALKRVAQHYTNGAKKYTKNNWKLGIPTERFFSSALRHLIEYRLGETEEDHLSAVIFNILGIIFNEEKDKEGFNREEYIRDIMSIPGSTVGNLEERSEDDEL